MARPLEETVREEKTLTESPQCQALFECFSAGCKRTATEYSPTGSNRVVYCRPHLLAALRTNLTTSPGLLTNPTKGR